MIVYHPRLNPNLEKYGISIPLKDERADKTFKLLNKKFKERVKVMDLRNIHPVDKEDLLRAHDPLYIKKLLDPHLCEEELIKCYELVDEQGKNHRYDPGRASHHLSEMVPEILLQAGASVYAFEQAIRHGFCFFLGGGMHHAMSFGGRGFCPVNDIVIGIRKLMDKGLVKKAWVVDVDAHKGDGTAQLSEGDESILTLSVHMEKGWPLEGPERDDAGKLFPWFIPSDVEVDIPEGEEVSYLAKLEEGLKELQVRSGDLPDLVVVVDGADPYEKDELPSSGPLRLSKKQMFERDKLIYNFFKQKGVPQAWLMAGGYGKHSFKIYSQFLEFALDQTS